MCHVYVLLSKKDHKSYTGSTPDLPRRLQEHFSGKCKATKYRLPLELIYTENFTNITEARQRERHLKTSTGRRELTKIFATLNL